MVKRGGTKRKAVIQKITDKGSKAVAFTKRRDGLFSKAAQLCILGDAQIAILATPSSSNSNVSFFSFGHSSVDSVVSAYLSGQRPLPVPVPEESKEMREDIGICMARKELGLRYWWEDEKLARSKDPQEIMQALESMKILQKAAQRLREDEVVAFDRRQGSLVAEQTLIPTEDDQIMSVSDSFCNINDKKAALSTPVDEKFEEWSDMDIEQFINGFEFENKTVEEEEEDHQVTKTEEWSDMDLQQLLSDVEKTEEKKDDHHQIISNNDNNALLLPAAAGEMNDDEQQLHDLDLDSIFEGLSGDEFANSFLMSW